MNALGYVVIEFNQASGQPRIVGDDIWNEADAQSVKEQAEAETRSIGRRERYAIATVEIVEGEA
jgi:hypothetical protein